MLESLKKPAGSLRWPPRQKFLATEVGRGALVEYDDAIGKLRSSGRQDRSAVAQVQGEWASAHRVDVRDALVLAELTRGERLPREVQGALEDCGISLQEVQQALDRLYAAGLVAAAGGAAPLAAGQKPRE